MLIASAFPLDAQFRATFSMDHSIGWVDNDVYFSTPAENIANGLFPSFTLTKHIKNEKKLVLQVLVRPNSRNGSASESINMLYQDVWKINNKYNYQIGLSFHIGQQELVNPGGIFLNRAGNRVKPSLALGISRNINFHRRYFLRIQAITLGKVVLLRERLRLGIAPLVNISFGIRFGKTDRAFPKQDEINDL